tara:strand:- start:735 stop:3053 length:2319 start_codon:yes stop_codon:yes gene_type:complete
MTDIVLPTKHWNDSDFQYNVFDDKILVLNFLTLHDYNVKDLHNGTATLYNRIVEAIQVAQVKDTNSSWQYIVLDNCIESMSSFFSPKYPYCPSSIVTELTDEFANDGYKFVWLTGNANAERNHKLWCNLNGVNANESWVIHRDVLSIMQLGQPVVNRVVLEQPKYLATCMNRFHKKHRGQMLQSLYDKNAFNLDRIKVTMPNRDDDPHTFNAWSEGLQKHLPIDLVEGGKPDDFIQWDWKKRIDDYKKFTDCYANSYIDIVSETFAGEYEKDTYDFDKVKYPFLQNFVTEKTWRCFHWKKPFLLNAEPNSIANLHALGFKTFGDFWDESYAGLSKMEDRCDAIADIVADMLTWDELKLNAVFDSPAMQEILEHNFNQLKIHAGKNTYEHVLHQLYTKQVEDVPFELDNNSKYQSPSFESYVYNDHLIIAPQVPLEFYNNDSLEEMYDIINMLGKGKHIVFDNSKEAIEKFNGHIGSPFHLMMLVDKRFNTQKLIYIDGNARVQTNYDNWLQQTNTESFMEVHYLHVFARLHKQFQPQIVADYSTPMTHTATFCNMIPKEHRADMLVELYNRGWLDQPTIYWTWHLSKSDSIGCEQWFENTEGLADILPNSGPDKLLHARNNEQLQWNPQHNKQLHLFIDIFNDSYFDIIGESHSFYDSANGFEVMFPTEKTWRSINYGRPFVINGPKFSIKHLQQLGFETFSDYWSEDYDQWGGKERTKSIADSIAPYLSGNIACYETFNSPRMREILRHNTNRFHEYVEQQTVEYLIDNVF